MNHLRSVHPARVLRIRKEESVPDDADDDGVNNACSGLPHIYCNKKEIFQFIHIRQHSMFQFIKNQC